LVTRIIAIAIAGAMGATARYWLAGVVQRNFGSGFPWGTFAVNVIGCFFFGLIWTLAESRLTISTEVRLIVLTGFMGAFTTFSTFIFEAEALIRNAQWLFLVGSIAGQIIIGLVFMSLGLMVGRLF
jgi:fluoride exporter